MSNNDGTRYCQRFSYAFLKFTLFSYAIVWWVSNVPVIVCDEERALCLHSCPGWMGVRLGVFVVSTAGSLYNQEEKAM